MQHLLSLEQIKERTEAVNLPIARLCKLADVAVSTVCRKETKGHRRGTLRDLSAALAAYEIERRDYLLGLHPLEEGPALSTVSSSVANPPGPGGDR